MLDAARAQPFIEGGQPIASGLALVEPDPNMLIAFNAAPGTVAPEEPGPYGVYAQSLAEMIRTGGLSLPEVFDRVRLRVNEASKGAQVPWDDAEDRGAVLVLRARARRAAAAGAPDQVAAIRNKPIRDLGVQDAYAAALERDTLPAYEEFLAAYPGDPMAKRVMAIVAARREAITWRRTYRADTPDAYWSYLRRYPRGPHAGDARRRLAILTAPLEPPPTFAMMDYDVPPPPPDEIVYVDRPVLYFGDPDVRLRAATAAAGLFLPPPPPDFVVLAPPLAGGRPVRAAAADVRADPGVRQAAGLCRAAAEQHHLPEHPQHHGHQHRDQPAAGGAWPECRRPAMQPTAGHCASGHAVRAGDAAGGAQRAALNQQGKAPMPPSATIKPTARPGTPPATPANVAPTGHATPCATDGPAAGQHAAGSRQPKAGRPHQAGQPDRLPGGRPGADGDCTRATRPPQAHPGAPTTARPAQRRPPIRCANGRPRLRPRRKPGPSGQPPKPAVPEPRRGTLAGRVRNAVSARRRRPRRARRPAPSGTNGKPVTRRRSAAREQIKPQGLRPATLSRAGHPAAAAASTAAAGGREAGASAPPRVAAPPPPRRLRRHRAGPPPPLLGPRRRRWPGRRHRRRPGWPSRPAAAPGSAAAAPCGAGPEKSARRTSPKC